MLQSIRDRAQNWIFLIIIFVLVLTFAFFGIERFFNGSVTTSVIAKVDGHKITQDEFNIAYQRLRRQLELQVGNQFTLTPSIEKNLKEQALKQLIHSYILTQAALNQGYRVTTDQIDSVLLSIPMFQNNGQFSADRFQAVLSNLLYTEDSFLAQLQTDMLVSQVQVGLVNSAFALPNEVTSAYQLINQKRDFSYVIIPSSKFINNITIPLSEQQQYYAKHQQQFTTPEKVSVSYLELSLQDLMAKQNFSESQLKDYYNNNKTNFSVPARWHVAQILVRLMPNADADMEKSATTKMAEIEQQLKNHHSFNDVAAKYSEDVFTAQNGGVLPWFNAGMTEAAIVEAVSKLKVGEVSPPVHTKFGLSVFKLLAYQPKQIEPFNKVTKQVKTMMAQDYAQKQFAAKSDKLSNLTFSDSGSLASASTALNLPIKTTDLFSKAGLKTGIASNPKIVNAAFGNSTLVEKYNSDPIQLNDTTVVVLRINNHVPAAIKPFEEVSNQIATILKSQAASVAANQLANQILAGSKSQSDLQNLATQNELNLKLVQNVGRHSSDVSGNILNQAFQLPKPNAKTPIIFSSLKLGNKGYAIIGVTAVNDGSISTMTPQDGKIFREQLASQNGQLDYGLYALQEINHAKVKIQKS